MSISIVLVLVQKCIVYQQIVGICCEILTFYCCNKYCLYISIFPLVSHRNMHLPIVLCCGTQRALFTSKIIIILVSNHTYLQSFVHVCIFIAGILLPIGHTFHQPSIASMAHAHPPIIHYVLGTNLKPVKRFRSGPEGFKPSPTTVKWARRVCNLFCARMWRLPIYYYYILSLCRIP